MLNKGNMDEVIDRLIYDVISQDDENIYGIINDGGPEDLKLRADIAKKLKGASDKYFKEKGKLFRFYYFHMGNPARDLRLEKKFGAHQELARFLYDGVMVPVVEAERYPLRKLSLNQFVLAAIPAWLVSSVLFWGFSFAIFEALAIGVALAVFLAYAASLWFSGASKDEQTAREKNFMFDYIYGDPDFLGFNTLGPNGKSLTGKDDNETFQNIVKAYPNAPDRFKTPLRSNEEAERLGKESYEMAENYDRTWALFPVDDKNYMGYTSPVKINGVDIAVREDGLNYRSGRESGIREAIRQGLADEKDIRDFQKQNIAIAYYIKDMLAKKIDLETASFNLIQEYFEDEIGLRGINVYQFLEEYGHYQPVRKAVAVLSHERNRFAAFGNINIEIAGGKSRWQEISVKFAKIGAAFDESKKRNLSPIGADQMIKAFYLHPALQNNRFNNLSGMLLHMLCLSIF